MNRWAWLGFGVVAVFGVVALWTRQLSSRRPAGLGVVDGRLATCPDRPNCVSSQATDRHAIEPFCYDGERLRAWESLLGVLRALPRCRIVSQQDNYIHAEFRSLVFGFVDDVEFLRGEDCIHVRSASRVGYSDLGVNRRRVERIREAFCQALSRPSE